ncbi:MAG: glycosyltransferase N-terminal domain-containing protein, partial [bacterium]
MLFIYDLLFLLVLIVYSPFLLIKFLRKKELSFLNECSQSPIWFHAASVGEVNGLYPIIDNIFQKNKYFEFAITTYTPTGLKRAKEIFSNYPVKYYSILPLDFSFIIKRFIKKMRPAIIIISETELWPNLISRAKKYGIKVIVVNGRISDRAWPNYSRFRLFFKNIVNKIDFYCAQTETDKGRIVSLGIAPNNVEVTGNSKYSFVPKITKEISINLSRPIIVAGSTRPGEEVIVL